MSKKSKSEKEMATIPDAEAQKIASTIQDAINKDQEKTILDSMSMPTMVESSVTLIHERNPFKKIEMAGRTCYKSEDAITKASAVKFARGLIKHQHMAMVEHAWQVFLIDCKDGSDEELLDYIQLIQKTDYVNVTVEPAIPRILISGNIRAILQRKVIDPIYRSLVELYPDFKIYDDSELVDTTFYNVTAEPVDVTKLKNLTVDEFMNHFYITAKFVTDRGVTHEMVRHRPFSFAQESTRYCNYSKDKFGGHCTFCEPSTFDDWTEDQKDVFFATLSSLDAVYTYLTTGDHPLSPQQARAILPNCLKTEIVVSGPAYEWKHFFDLRSKGTTGAPHPDIKIVADEALKKVNKYIKSLKFENVLTF